MYEEKNMNGMGGKIKQRSSWKMMYGLDKEL